SLELMTPVDYILRESKNCNMWWTHTDTLFSSHNYYNGYRGVVVARPGYRFYRGYWFPPAAFAAGVIVGRTLAHPVPPARRLTAAH
ncbi:hypothetical protein ACJWUR_26745, partial [Klebsiella pneumoniae]